LGSEEPPTDASAIPSKKVKNEPVDKIKKTGKMKPQTQP